MDLYLLIDLIGGLIMVLPPEAAGFCYGMESAYEGVLCLKQSMV